MSRARSTTLVMGLAKMAPNSWRYYAEEVAAGREDYYAKEQVAGRWLGAGAAALALSGAVDTVAMERLFGRGTHPETGIPLGRPYADREGTVSGFALSFSPPKSVSVLWALAPEKVAAEVQAGHDAAVREAMALLHEHASFTRRGHNGIYQVETEGVLAASFTHRTSRAGDP